MIIWFLLEHKILRFAQLKEKINAATKITDKMLIQCLRQLERDGIISRKIFPVVPPKVEYSLTENGQKLRPIFDQLIQFGLSHSTKTK